MLEIIGTFLGAIHSVFLQRKVKGFNRTVNNMIQCKVDLKITLKLYVNALEIEEKRKEDEQREKAINEQREKTSNDQREKASNDHFGENGLSGQNIEDPPGQELEEISTQNPEEGPRQLQVEKYDTQYYPVQTASSMFTGIHRVKISGGTFVTNTNNNVNSFLGRSIEEDIDDQKERLERLQSTMQEIRSLNNTQLGVIGLIENILEKAREILKLDVRGVHNPSDSAQDSSYPPTVLLARVLTQPFNVSALSPGPYNAEATPPIFKFGNIPVLSMASGVVCLAISTILLSAANKGLGMEVWITSTLVLAMVAVLSVFPFRLVLLNILSSRCLE